jgi:hypothetical protein
MAPAHKRDRQTATTHCLAKSHLCGHDHFGTDNLKAAPMHILENLGEVVLSLRLHQGDLYACIHIGINIYMCVCVFVCVCVCARQTDRHRHRYRHRHRHRNTVRRGGGP